MRVLFFAFWAIFFIGCGTSDSSLKNHGKSASYIQGFHDGRHSGMQEAGNNWEHYIRDEVRFKSDADYHQGWVAGESEGKQLQAQATAIGNAAATGYGTYRVNEEVERQRDFDNIAKEGVKGADASLLKNLE